MPTAKGRGTSSGCGSRCLTALTGGSGTAPSRLTALEIGDRVAFSPEHVITIDFSDEELGYAQDQWPMVDAVVLSEDRAPDAVIRAPGPYVAVRTSGGCSAARPGRS